MHLLEEDLAHVMTHAADAWPALAGKRLFITGGSGFFGSWLVESLLVASAALAPGLVVTVLTRDAGALRRQRPRWSGHPALRVCVGDIAHFTPPPQSFDFLIHAAATPTTQVENAAAAIDDEIAGFQRLWAFARQSGVKRVLFTSSGGIYGSGTGDTPITEDEPRAVDPTRTTSRYGELKRLSELYGTCCAAQDGIDFVIARCFSAFGAFQPLDSHFALPNFIADALAGRDIVVKGDGKDRRSYLYAADLTVWLLQLLIAGATARPYHVGSDHPLSIAELAEKIAALAEPPRRVVIAGQTPDALAGRTYVPSIQRAADELGLRIRIPLELGLERTMRWHRVGVAAFRSTEKIHENLQDA